MSETIINYFFLSKRFQKKIFSFKIKFLSRRLHETNIQDKYKIIKLEKNGMN